MLLNQKQIEEVQAKIDSHNESIRKEQAERNNLRAKASEGAAIKFITEASKFLEALKEAEKKVSNKQKIK